MSEGIRSAASVDIVGVNGRSGLVGMSVVSDSVGGCAMRRERMSIALKTEGRKEARMQHQSQLERFHEARSSRRIYAGMN